MKIFKKYCLQLVFMGVVCVTVTAQLSGIAAVAAPKAGPTTIGAVITTLNQGYSGIGTFLLVTDAKRVPIVANDLVPNGSGWARIVGSTSVNQVFGQTFTQTLPKAQQVTLVTDQTLISKMQASSRLPKDAASAGVIHNALNRIFLYFVYPVKGVNYRFYLNDPFPPAGIMLPGHPAAYPAVNSIINRFNCG